jgi:transcriptional regulator with XRE-family HTH domain
MAYPNTGCIFRVHEQTLALPSSVFTAQYARFCELLTAHRRRSGLTQTELAGKLGKPQSFVSKYERGERRLDLVEFLQIAHALGADPCAIIRQIENPNARLPNDP